jgi:hypothetical protein
MDQLFPAPVVKWLVEQRAAVGDGGDTEPGRTLRASEA